MAERLTKRQKRDAARSARLEAEAKQVKAITRRALLVRSAVALATLVPIAALANAVYPYINEPSGPDLKAHPRDLGEKLLIDSSEAYTRIEIKAPSQISAIGAPSFDKSYALDVLNSLEQPRTTTPRERLISVYENMATIGLGSFGGNCFQFDESGYFLTVAHVPLSLAKEGPRINQQVHFPESGDVHKVETVLSNSQFDLAVVFAPTGKKRKPVPGVEIDSRPLSVAEKLWMPFWYPGGTKDMMVRILHGEIQSTKDVHNPPYQGHVAVEGMKPYGGCSGAAVVDAYGRVRAVESGAIVAKGEQGNLRSEYAAARVVPIDKLKLILQ